MNSDSQIASYIDHIFFYLCGIFDCYTLNHLDIILVDLKSSRSCRNLLQRAQLNSTDPEPLAVVEEVHLVAVAVEHRPPVVELPRLLHVIAVEAGP